MKETNENQADRKPMKSSQNTMKPTVYSSIELIFGKGDASIRLPEGWILMQSERDWLKARDNDGRIYFLSDSFAYPQRTNDEGSYVDTEEGVIKLP